MDLVVGRIAKAHGITGELVVEVRTDDPDDRFRVGKTLRLRSVRAGVDSTAVVSAVRPHGGRLLVRLEGVADRDAADRLRGALFLVDSGDLPTIEDPDEFYDHQLEGLQVCTVSGQRLGAVSEVVHTAGGELLSVRTESGGEVLVPFVSAIVCSVSLRDGVIEIDPPEGLLDLD